MKIQNIRYAMLTADLVWIFAALGLGIGLRYAGANDPIGFTMHYRSYSLMLLAAVAAWTFLYFELSLEGFKGGWHFPAIFSKLIVAVSLLMVIVLALAFLTEHPYSRLVLLYFATFFLIVLVGSRCFSPYLISSQLINPEAN